MGNAITAALLKSATGTFSTQGVVAFLSTWQTYGFALTGVASVLLLENALQAGTLYASQPALTIGDATVSLLLGVTVFDETIRTGWWLVPGTRRRRCSSAGRGPADPRHPERPPRRRLSSARSAPRRKPGAKTSTPGFAVSVPERPPLRLPAGYACVPCGSFQFGRG